MFDRRVRCDRRREPRQTAAGRISWFVSGDQAKRTGWLSDATASSVSFVTCGSCRPVHGEEIEVVRRDQSRQRSLVTRVEAFDERLILIACRHCR